MRTSPVMVYDNITSPSSVVAPLPYRKTALRTTYRRYKRDIDGKRCSFGRLKRGTRLGKPERPDNPYRPGTLRRIKEPRHTPYTSVCVWIYTSLNSVVRTAGASAPCMHGDGYIYGNTMVKCVQEEDPSEGGHGTIPPGLWPPSPGRRALARP